VIATPDQTIWYLLPTLTIDQQEVTALARKKAAFIVATNILDVQRLSHEQVIRTYQEQGGVERGTNDVLIRKNLTKQPIKSPDYNNSFTENHLTMRYSDTE